MRINGALGIIEVYGLAAAITAVDAAMKAANVTYVNYFKTGNGSIQVRLVGDVGAVQAAVAAAKMEASKCGLVLGTSVIPRPHNDLKAFIGHYGLMENSIFMEEPEAEAVKEPAAETEAVEEPAAEAEAVEEPAVEAEPEEAEAAEEPVTESEPEEAETAEEPAAEAEAVEEPAAEAEPEKDAREASGEITCNICHDPKCPRMRGQSKKLCIHYRDS